MSRLNRFLDVLDAAVELQEPAEEEVAEVRELVDRAVKNA